MDFINLSRKACQGNSLIALCSVLHLFGPGAGHLILAQSLCNMLIFMNQIRHYEVHDILWRKTEIL